MNSRVKDVKNYQQAGDTPITAKSLKGPRSEQQDSYAVFRLRKPLSEQRLREIFLKASSDVDLHNSSSIDHQSGGTTLNLASITPDQIIAANVGDSYTVLFTRAHENDRLHGEQLSINHNLDNPDELARIRGLMQKNADAELAPSGMLPEDEKHYFIEGAYVCTETLNGTIASLNVTRALGDRNMGKVISKRPDVRTIDLDQHGASRAHEAHLALYSDGAVNLEYDLLGDADYMAHYMDEGVRQGKNLAEHMVSEASKLKLLDNVSVVSADLNALRDTGGIYLLLVADGHGPRGAQCAKAAIDSIENNPEIECRLL